MRYWDVGGSVPPNTPGNPRGYANTIVVHVVATSASVAISLVETKYPGIAVHTVQHRGKLDIIQGES